MDPLLAMNKLYTFHRTVPGKILLSFLGIILLSGFILFTPLGNRFMKPIVEKSLSLTIDTPISLETFSLSHNRFQLLFHDEIGNAFSAQGGFSLLTLRMYAHYRLSCIDKGGINPLVSPFKTEGSLSGGIAALTIHGNGNMFGGDLLYKMEFHRFRLASLNLQGDQIDYASLMRLLRYPCDTDTLITGVVNLKGLDQRNVEGSILLSSRTGRFSHTPILEDSNSTVTLKSLLTEPNGDVRAFNVNITLEASLAHAGILEQFIGVELSGPIRLSATLKGDQKRLRLKSYTDVAQSDASVTVDIIDLEPLRIGFDFKHADIERTFELFNHKAPIAGEGEFYGELNTSGGTINAVIADASTVPAVFLQEYSLTQPKLRFGAEIHAELAKEGVHYTARFNSDLSRMEIDNTTTHDQMLRELLQTLR